MNPQAPYQGMPNAAPSLPSPAPGMPVMMPQSTHHRPWILIGLLVLFVLLFLGTAGFSFWAYGEYQDYKLNSDKKAAAAAEVAVKANTEKKDKEFAEQEKNPYRDYKGPAQLGTIGLTYPKTWSVYMDEGTPNRVSLDGFMHPAYVPAKDSGTSFALRVEVIENTYDQVMRQFESEAKRGVVKIQPYSAPKVPSVLGSRVDGEIVNDLNGSMVVFPLRDKTIKVSTQSQVFINDFNNIILPNLTFVP